MAIIQNKSNMYELMDFWLDNVAPKYFDLEDLSLSTVGLFGYINSIMANGLEANINETSVLFNEYFMNKARLPESILAYASNYNVSDINATPAVMKFCIAIREDILLENAVTEGDDTFFVIDKDTELIVEDQIKYLLDYDIKVNIKHRNGKYIYSAAYMSFNNGETDTNIIVNPLSQIGLKSNPYITVVRMKDNGANYLYFYVLARQVKKHVINRNIYQEEFIDYYTFDIDYEGMLADFYVLYKEPNSKNYIQLEKVLQDAAPSVKPFFFYQYKDDNTIGISFSTMSRYFRPKFNSELKIVLFTTDGANGNFTYKGNNVTIKPKSDIYDYSRVIMLAGSVSNSEGGFNTKTYDEIKEETSFRATTSFNIGTTIDLNKYFAHIQNEKKFSFIKKRDDILDRLFTCFTLMKDEDGNIMPTNTLDMIVDEDDFDYYEENSKRYVMKAGRKLSYHPNTKYVIPMDINERLPMPSPGDLYPKFSDDFHFTNPYVMVMSKNPFTFTYYLNSINKKFLTDFEYINEKTFCNFIINSVDIKRNAIVGEEFYTITFRAMCNGDEEMTFANLDEDGKFVSSNGNLVIKGTIYDKDGGLSYYFNTTMKDYDTFKGEYLFEARIYTDDYVSVENALRTIRSIYPRSSDTLSADGMIYASNMKLGLVVFVKDEEPIIDTYHSYIPKMLDYSVANAYVLSDRVNLINNLGKLVNSTIVFKDSYTNLPTDDKTPFEPVKDPMPNHFYIIRGVPLSSFEYLSVPKYSDCFARNVLNSVEILNDSTLNITNNFSIDFKFYNTYGKSYYFYLKEKERLINKVIVMIDITIKINPNKLTDTLLKTEIKDFIKKYIEESNETNNFYLSGLFQSLENQFPDITYVYFNDMNRYGTECQVVEKDFPNSIDSPELMREFVPEFLNIYKLYDRASKEVLDAINIHYI